MYTTIMILAIIVMMISIFLTVYLANNQKKGDYKSDTTTRYKNLLWVYLIGTAIALAGVLIYLNL